MNAELPAEVGHPEVRDARLAVTLFLAVVGLAVGSFVIAISLDVTLTSLSWSAILDAMTRQGFANSMNGLAEVLAAVLGLSLTVVAIVVELASERYPAKIVDIFMFDDINVWTFVFMTASCIYVAVLPVVVTNGTVAVIAAGFGLFLAVVNFGVLLPFFGHVFTFLEPTNIITQMESRARDVLRDATSAGLEGAALTRAQRQAAAGVERIADNCMAAVSQSDRNLALHSVRTLEAFVVRYLNLKEDLPPRWSAVDWDFFGTLAQEFVDEIVDSGTWLEAKTLMEFERIIRRALEEMNEVVSQIGASTRVMGQAAIAHGEHDTVELAIRFFNTYVRHGLNAGNVRAVYNVLYEYRRFTLAVFDYDRVLGRRLVEYLVYYGRTANEMKMPFVTVTVAHDVGVICQEIFARDGVDFALLVDRFLTLDQPSEARSEEVALIGVRKAQSILGAFLLEQGEDEIVERIRDDMRNEKRERLQLIRDEILAVEESKFWEITDRGLNFDYVPPSMRPYVTAFFEPLV